MSATHVWPNQLFNSDFEVSGNCFKRFQRLERVAPGFWALLSLPTEPLKSKNMY